LTRRQPITDKKNDPKRTFESRHQIERATQETLRTEKSAQLEQAASAEDKEKQVDFSVPFIDTQIVGKVKHTQNPILKLFLERERGLAMNRIFDQRALSSTPSAQPSQSLAARGKKAPSEHPSESKQPETPSETTEKKWGPRSR
jgi:hypothetical protein